MPELTIRPFFPFRRVKIASQLFENGHVRFIVTPDRRFTPVCRVCGKACNSIHSYRRRAVRDLDMAETRVFLHCLTRKLRCSNCGCIAVEDCDFLTPSSRVTRRLARYIHELCRILPVAEVARHVGLDWKTVKNIDKEFLEKDYGETNYEGLSILAVDEIAVKKGHRYMTVVLDYSTGRVVWVGNGRKTETLKEFYEGMTEEQRRRIKAVAMDMWDPYIKATRECLPNARIVFDFFHMVSAFNKVIDQVRRDEYRKAAKQDKSVYRGSRYILLKLPGNLKYRERRHLNELVSLNETIFYLLILRDMLRSLWKYRSRWWAMKAIGDWCRLARSIDHPAVKQFANRIEHYEEGILNHCEYPIHTSLVEGVNNKIKVIKRMAYGFHDDRYFSLKIIQAFDPKLKHQNGR